jgi:hypothetical protein
VNPDLRHDSRFFTGVEGVVDCFLYRGEQCLTRIIKPEEMPILGEKLADGNIALLCRHRFGGCPARRSLRSTAL